MMLDEVPSTLGLHLQFKVLRSPLVKVSQLHVSFDLNGSWWQNKLSGLVHECLPFPPLYLGLD